MSTAPFSIKKIDNFTLVSTRKTQDIGVYLGLYPRTWVAQGEIIRCKNRRVVNFC